MGPTDAALLTISEAARRLGMSRRALYVRHALGHLPVVRLGGRVVRIDPADLDDYVRRRKATAQA